MLPFQAAIHITTVNPLNPTDFNRTWTHLDTTLQPITPHFLFGIEHHAVVLQLYIGPDHGKPEGGEGPFFPVHVVQLLLQNHYHDEQK